MQIRIHVESVTKVLMTMGSLPATPKRTFLYIDNFALNVCPRPIFPQQ